MGIKPTFFSPVSPFLAVSPSLDFGLSPLIQQVRHKDAALAKILGLARLQRTTMPRPKSLTGFWIDRK
jgi:hypothetical protein